jgi:hypothetical protein
MTSTFLKLCNQAFKVVFSAEIKIHPHTLYNNLRISLFGLGLHGIYAYGTETTAMIQMVDKYTMVNHGTTSFMVVDGDGRHFNVNNSLWFWKWDSIEDWHNLKLHEPLLVRYYGVRYPLLGFFPNIVYHKPDVTRKRKWDNKE